MHRLAAIPCCTRTAIRGHAASGPACGSSHACTQCHTLHGAQQQPCDALRPLLLTPVGITQAHMHEHARVPHPAASSRADCVCMSTRPRPPPLPLAAGCGPVLHVYQLAGGRLLAQQLVFDGCRIHGITSSCCGGDSACGATGDGTAGGASLAPLAPAEGDGGGVQSPSSSAWWMLVHGDRHVQVGWIGWQRAGGRKCPPPPPLPSPINSPHPHMHTYTAASRSTAFPL